MEISLQDHESGCTLPVRVHPGAKRNAITGVHDGAIKVSLTTPPTDGRANAALLAFLAKELGVAQKDIELLRGATSRSKVLFLRGKNADSIRRLLAAWMDK